MFVRRFKRSNGQVSVVLVENYRDGGRVKQRTIEYLGTEAKLNATDPEAVNKLIAKYKGQKSETETLIKLTLNPADKIAPHNTIRNYGYLYLEKMYQELGLLTSAMRLPSVPRTVHRTAGRWLFARV